MSNLASLKDLRDKLKKAEHELLAAKTERKTLLKRLKEEFDLKDLEAAKRAARRMNKQIQDWTAEIDERYEKLKEAVDERIPSS